MNVDTQWPSKLAGLLSSELCCLWSLACPSAETWDVMCRHAEGFLSLLSGSGNNGVWAQDWGLLPAPFSLAAGVSAHTSYQARL